MPDEPHSHALTSAWIGDHAEPPVVTSLPRPAPTVHLSAIDQLGAEAFVGGDTGDLLEFVRSLSQALSSGDADGTRLRMLSKSLASERAHQAVLQAMVGKQLARGDLKAAAMLDRMCTASANRIATLARAHGEETRPRRNVLVVAHADEVRVGPQEE